MTLGPRSCGFSLFASHWHRWELLARRQLVMPCVSHCWVIGRSYLSDIRTFLISTCRSTLGDRTHLFGHQRAWGSLGWGVFALMSGFLVDAMSDGKVMKNYSGLFYTMLVVITFDWLVVLRMQVGIMTNTHRLPLSNHYVPIRRTFTRRPAPLY